LSQDIEGYKDVMEELNEICEILMEKCACSWVRDQTNETHEKYSALMTQIQGKIAIPNCSVKSIFYFLIDPNLFYFILQH
jgi:hypothetical protein